MDSPAEDVAAEEDRHAYSSSYQSAPIAAVDHD
jgi:hypothetical protein